MDKAYEEFKQLVDAGKLVVTYIDAAPRTVSAAFFRSLTHVHDASGYEPFKYGNNFEESIKFLLGQAQKSSVHTASVTQPIKLVVKELARELPSKDWANWMPLVKNFAVIMRDPYLQLWSQMRRFANDIFYNQRGADGLSETQIYSMADQVGMMLEHGGTIGNLSFTGNFNRTAWQDLKSHCIALHGHLKKYPQKQLIIIDSFLLWADPDSIMSEVLTRLKIKFDAATLRKMVSQWSPATAQHLREGTTEPDSAYRARSARATGYEPPLEETPPLKKFPLSLQRHLVETAMPTYLDLLHHPERVGPKTPQELTRVISKEVKGVALIDRNPVTAYALISSLIEDDQEADESEEKNLKLTDLRHEFPEHRDVFNLIDQHRSSTPNRLRYATDTVAN